MESEQGALQQRKAEEMKLSEKINLRTFKSMGRRNVQSPKLATYLNKENAKNFGNVNLRDKGVEENGQNETSSAVKSKSSNKPAKKVDLAEININNEIEKPDLSALLSNKAKSKFQFPQPNKNEHNKQSDIITEGISKDGQYQVTSRALYGDQLLKAVQMEHRINLKAKKTAIKELSTAISPRGNKFYAEPSKTSTKENGIVKAYAVNTHQGISRNYNEDRVSIILNITKNGIKAAYFAIYDGHGGSPCCDFLSEYLHQFILNSKKFPSHPRQAIIEGIRLVEEKFLQKTKQKYNLHQQIDRSGSCALISLIVGNDCYIANIGDSRAILSTCKGKPLYSLSRDHKPTDANQQNRILKEGGRIYRTEMQKISDANKNKGRPKSQLQNQLIVGPLRVFPGKLSVTRTFGDIEAKDPDFGGIRNCICIDPQICKYSLNGKEDFIVLGCDGIFQKMDSEEVIEDAWRHLKKGKNENIHQACGSAASGIVNTCMKRKSMDNLTVIIIFLGQLDTGVNMAEYRSV